MTELTKCVECGAQVSPAAAECPSCHRYPRFLTCSFCGRPLRGSQEVGQMHPDCYKASRAAKEADSFSCPACGVALAHGSFNFALVRGPEQSSPASTSPCPKCGHPIEVVKCDQCGGGLVRGSGERVQRRSQFPLYVHKSCVRFVRNRVEKVEAGGPKTSCLVVVFALAALPPALLYLIGKLL